MLLFLFILFALFGLREAGAALVLLKDIGIKECTNPYPAQNDILLPMPCGGRMAFVPVAVPTEGFLWDKQLRLGSVSSARPEDGYYDSRFAASISGPFSLDDFPEAWRSIFPRSETIHYNYFMMSKYEVSIFQWKSVLEGIDGNCPAIDSESARPVSEISWHEAQFFIYRYMNWLLKNWPDALPRFAGDETNIGYLRLPTEAEWEYAARGGQAVGTEVLLHEEFFPLGEGSIEDYAVFRPEGTGRIEEHPASIGSRKPNPLGLYDMAGNVAEMTLDPFHFSLAGRLHGSVGGFIRKGGSYRSGLAEVMPGRREEIAPFIIDGPLRAKDLGFRLVLSGINTPGGQRPAELRREWKESGQILSRRGEEKFYQQKGIGQKIEDVKKDTHDEKLLDQLAQLQAALKSRDMAVEREQAVTTENYLRSALLTLEHVRHCAELRGAELERAMLYVNRFHSREAGMSEVEQAQVVDGMKRQLYILDNLREEIEHSILFYKTILETINNFSSSAQTMAINQLAAETRGDSSLAQRTRHILDIFEKHLTLIRWNKLSELDKTKIYEDILPSVSRMHWQELEKALENDSLTKRAKGQRPGASPPVLDPWSREPQGPDKTPPESNDSSRYKITPPAQGS